MLPGWAGGRSGPFWEYLVMSNGALVLLCGTSFSGKTTVARAVGEQLRACVISLDEINLRRGLHSGQGVAVIEWQRTHDIAREEARAVVEAGGLAVIDDTSSPRFLRDGWRKLASELCCVLQLVYVKADRDTVLRRRAANDADPARAAVRDEILSDHLDRFEPPEADEHALVIRPGDEIRSWIGRNLSAIEDT